MEEEEATQELETEEELDEVPYVEYDINVSPSDPTLELLVNQLERGDIIVPPFQRKYVWKIDQASKLIESFLMGLPVPQIFLFVNKEDQLEVIDGHQRLLSVKYFFEGYFGEADSRGKRQVFKLKGLAERSEYNQKEFKELLPRDQRRLKNSTLRAINVKQVRPSGDGDSVFHIFERLNTGGTQLKPQEIRNAVIRGNIVRELQSLNNNSEWREILGIKKPDKHQRDVELVLRLFSLFRCWQDYEKPMLRHLNQFMRGNKDFSSDNARLFKQRFPEAVSLINQSIDKPFRPRRVLNSAILEAVFIAVLEDTQIKSDELSSRYPRLFDDKDFNENTTGATTDTAVLQSRISAAKKILGHGQA